MTDLPSPRQPIQRRSRERQERILRVAAGLIAESGSDSLRMAEVAAQSKISIGSLYQYFPDKTALIAALSQHFYAKGHACVRAALGTVTTEAELREGLCQIVQEYYQFYLDEPALRNIWGATQSDQVLRDMDSQDLQLHAQQLLGCLRRLRPQESEEVLAAEALLEMYLINAVVRLAITLPPAQAQVILAQFMAREFPKP